MTEIADTILSLYGEHLQWNTVNEFFDYITHKGFSINIGLYVCPWQVRQCIMENVMTSLYDSTQRRIQLQDQQALKDGAVGISIGFSGLAEQFFQTITLYPTYIVDTKNIGGLFTMGLRLEDERAVFVLKKTKNLVEDPRIPIEFMKIKFNKPFIQKHINTFFSTFDSIRAEGYNFEASIVPLPIYITKLSAFLPKQFKHNGVGYLKMLFEFGHQQPVFHQAFQETYPNPDSLKTVLKTIRFAEIYSQHNKHLIGKTLFEAFGDKPQFVDSLINIYLTEQFDPVIQVEQSDDYYIKTAITKPWVTLATGAPLLTHYAIGIDSVSSILYYAPFPAAIARYVRDESVIPIETMIQKMTSQNADRLKIKNRGRLITGNYADITVFDMSKISPVTSYVVTPNYDTGVRYVLINGKMVYENGKHTGKYAGKIIFGSGKK
jgi:hypothetical protein